MRFGLVHRVMTDALAALGVLSLVVSGQFHRLVSLALLAGLALAVSLKEPWRAEAARRRLDTISLVVLIVVQLARASLTATSGVDLLIEFAVGLQIIRVASRRGAAHDQQVIVLALLHLIAGTVVGGGLGYGLCFIGLLIVTPGALVLSHLRREVEGNYRQGARDRTGLPVDVPRILRSKRVVGRKFVAVTCLLAVPILLFTSALFIAFPRVGLSLLLLNRPHAGRMIGFSDKVDLGQIGTLRADPTIALRVTFTQPTPEPPPSRLVMHLRGTALDAYDGRTWTQSIKQSRPVGAAGEFVPLATGAVDIDTPTLRIDLDPIDPPVLFLPPTAAAIRLAPNATIGPGGGLAVFKGPEGEVRYQAAADRPVRYEVFLDPTGRETYRSLRGTERARYLQLPADLPDRIRTLAATWVDGITGDAERANAVAERLRASYRYDLASPSGRASQPLDDFLFESNRGHCEYFSTAMAVMVRTLGIPSRNVTGFIGGTLNRFGGFYAVRQGDAHSWVEAYIEGRGWVTFDPTPASAARPLSEVEGALAVVRDLLEAVSQRWDRHVLGYDLSQQVGLFDRLGARSSRTGRLLDRPRWRTILAAVGLGLAAAGAYLLWRRRRARRGAAEGQRIPENRAHAIAVGLYEMLDRAMVQLGVTRALATPPLRHAERLAASGHPLGPEVLSLTERYLEARFGSQPLAPAERRQFEGRVRRLHWVAASVPPTPDDANPDRASDE